MSVSYTHLDVYKRQEYLKLLNKTINQVLQTPGRHVQSVAEASYDAWVKYYRQDENTPNATAVSYTHLDVYKRQ